MENNTELIQAILISLECIKQYPKEQQVITHPLGYNLMSDKENKPLKALEHQLENLLILHSTPEQYVDSKIEDFDFEDIDVQEVLFEKCTSFKVLEDNKLIRSCISLLKYKGELKKIPFVPKNVDDEFIGLDSIH